MLATECASDVVSKFEIASAALTFSERQTSRRNGGRARQCSASMALIAPVDAPDLVLGIASAAAMSTPSVLLRNSNESGEPKLVRVISRMHKLAASSTNERSTVTRGFGGELGSTMVRPAPDEDWRT